MELKSDQPIKGTQENAGLYFKEDETPAATAMQYGQQENQTVKSEWGQYDGWNNQNDEPYISNQSRMSKKEFYKHSSMKKVRGNINACCIMLYISAAITFLFHIVLLRNLLGIVDVLVLLGLALGIHIGKSRVCAIILLAYSAINTIYMLISTGRLGGYLILICGIYAVIETFKFQKAWNEYEMTGNL